MSTATARRRRGRLSLAGKVRRKRREYFINCFLEPPIPEGWKLVSHQTSDGVIKWRRSYVTLYQHEGQKLGEEVSGGVLLEALRTQPVLNASVLDFLLDHPRSIPKSWKRKEVFFWGTLYLDGAGDLCVRSLCWDEKRGEWVESYHCPDYSWTNKHFAAVWVD